MGFIQAIFFFLRALLTPRLSLAAENLALRQQVAICKHSGKRPKLRLRDRLFWVLLSRLWSSWRSPPLVQLAFRPGHRPTRHGHQMAPAGVQALLAMEVESREARASPRPTRDP